MFTVLQFIDRDLFEVDDWRHLMDTSKVLLPAKTKTVYYALSPHGSVHYLTDSTFRKRLVSRVQNPSKQISLNFTTNGNCWFHPTNFILLQDGDLRYANNVNKLELQHQTELRNLSTLKNIETLDINHCLNIQVTSLNKMKNVKNLILCRHQKDWIPKLNKSFRVIKDDCACEDCGEHGANFLRQYMPHVKARAVAIKKEIEKDKKNSAATSAASRPRVNTGVTDVEMEVDEDGDDDSLPNLVESPEPETDPVKEEEQEDVNDDNDEEDSDEDDDDDNNDLPNFLKAEIILRSAINAARIEKTLDETVNELPGDRGTKERFKAFAKENIAHIAIMYTLLNMTD